MARAWRPRWAGAAHGQSFAYPDFSSVAGLDLNGNATQNANKLRLTQALGNQGGSAFSFTPISRGLNASFSAFFSFEILGRGGLDNGADGLTFAVQANSSSVGGFGGGLGYNGIPNSIAVEFDIYNNGETGGSNHVGIDAGGSIASLSSTPLLTPDFDNGSPWFAWVDDNGAISNLEVRWSQINARPAASMLSRTLDVATALGSNAYVGFTAATGGAGASTTSCPGPSRTASTRTVQRFRRAACQNRAPMRSWRWASRR